MSIKKCEVTAILVNYFSSAYSIEAVKSIFSTSGFSSIKVVVVDNSCDKNEENVLASGLPESAELIVNSKNVGFGMACNQVFNRSDSDLFFLLNPDAQLIGNALYNLYSTLRNNTRLGAVSPQPFWDDELKFFISPAHDPRLFLFQPELGQWGPNSKVSRFISQRWRRYSMHVWRAQQPVRVSNICGGHVLLKRDAVFKAGGLFDPRFFLYFEDTDLFLRMRQSGYELAVDPQARVVHHYDQCDPANRAQKRKLISRSMDLFVAKHIRKKHLAVKKILQTIHNLKTKQQDMFREASIDDPKIIYVPEEFQGSWLLEWSPNPDFIPSVGCFGQGPQFSFSDECLRKLASGKYYLRISQPTYQGSRWPVYTWYNQNVFENS